MLPKVVASLVYSDDNTLVEKPVDADAALLTSYDGIEYACSDRPSKVISGRASFKLKISQVLDSCISSFSTCKTKWTEVFVDCNLELENTCFGEGIFINTISTCEKGMCNKANTVSACSFYHRVILHDHRCCKFNIEFCQSVSPQLE